MKKIIYHMTMLVMSVLVLASCSKEDNEAASKDQTLIEISFGSILADFNDQSEQDTPQECREGTPAYVHVGITDNAGNYVGDDGGTSAVNLVEVTLKYNTSLEVWETLYSEELALPAGNYELQHFIVYDSSDQVLWVAPREEGSFGDYVANPLPHDIVLTEGTKPYITVDVLCYYSRSEDAYGYVFFDIDLNRVENSYCIFVNYCDDGSGREYPAHFKVEVWSDGYDGTPVGLSNNTNTITEATTGWPAASVLCIALPDLGTDTYYARVTVLNHVDLDYTPDASDIHEFTFTQADIDGQELFIPAYNHIRINCSPNGGGGDDVCNTDVRCELNLENQLSDNCEFTYLEGSDQGWVRIDSAGDLDLLASVESDEFELGDVNISLVNNNEVRVILDTPYRSTDRMIAYAVEVRPRAGNAMNATCWETKCANVVNEYGEIELRFDGFNYTYPFYLKVETINCFSLDDLLD